MVPPRRFGHVGVLFLQKKRRLSKPWQRKQIINAQETNGDNSQKKRGLKVGYPELHWWIIINCPYPAMLIDFAGLPAIFRCAQIRNLVLNPIKSHVLSYISVHKSLVSWISPTFSWIFVDNSSHQIKSHGESRIFLILKSLDMEVSVLSRQSPQSSMFQTDFPWNKPSSNIFFAPKNRKLVGGLNPLKNDGVRQLGWWNSMKFPNIMESHSKFHGSSHHQPGNIRSSQHPVPHSSALPGAVRKLLQQG